MVVTRSTKRRKSKSKIRKSKRMEGYLYYYKSPKYFTIYGLFGAWFLSMDHSDSEMMFYGFEMLCL